MGDIGSACFDLLIRSHVLWFDLLALNLFLQLTNRSSATVCIPAMRIWKSAASKA